MNQAITLTLGVVLGLAMQPSITRPSPNRVVVEGADWAGIQPEAAVVVGEPFMWAWALNEGGVVEFVVDPLIDYEVHTFEPEVDGERAHAVIEIGPSRENLIDNIISNRIAWETEFNQMIEGTHPRIQGRVDYFELGQSIIRVQTAASP